MELDLTQFLTVKTIAQAIENGPKVNTPIKNRLFGDARTWPLPAIPLSEVNKITRNVPVVRRGTQSHAFHTGGLDNMTIEPQGFDVSSPLTATELNNMKLLPRRSVQEMVNTYLYAHQEVIKLSTEALCAQAMTGRITYPMKDDSGNMLDVYEVEYGAPQRLDVTTAWTATSKPTDIFSHLTAMQKVLSEGGWGGNLHIFAGKKAYDLLMGTINLNAKNNAIVVQIGKDRSSLGQFSFELIATGYTDLNSGNFVSSVPDNEIVMVDLGAPIKLWYCALDDLQANLQPLPFWANPIRTQDPSGIKIKSMSKPIPAPALKAICWSKVV